MRELCQCYVYIHFEFRTGSLWRHGRHHERDNDRHNDKHNDRHNDSKRFNNQGTKLDVYYCGFLPFRDFVISWFRDFVISSVWLCCHPVSKHCSRSSLIEPTRGTNVRSRPTSRAVIGMDRRKQLMQANAIADIWLGGSERWCGAVHVINI